MTNDVSFIDEAVEVGFLQVKHKENSKFRSMKELALMRERETAIQTLLNALGDQVTELNDEKKSIQTSVLCFPTETVLFFKGIIFMFIVPALVCFASSSMKKKRPPCV